MRERAPPSTCLHLHAGCICTLQARTRTCAGHCQASKQTLHARSAGTHSVGPYYEARLRQETEVLVRGKQLGGSRWDQS